MKLQHAESFGGPFIILPRNLVGSWVRDMGDHPTPDEGLYGKACHLDNPGYICAVPLQGTEVISITEDPSDIFWVPRKSGGLIIQWLAADSLEDLIAFGERVADNRDQWDETLEFEVPDSEVRIMDSCGFETDDQPKIDITLVPGLYQIKAALGEDETTMATVFEITRQSAPS
ncbi:Imm21 family immunity protein [Verrucomicrobiaceae bacterium 227]